MASTTSMPPKMKWGLILAGIIVGTIVLAVIAWKVKIRFQAWKAAQVNQSHQNALTAQGIQLSYNPNEFEAFANKLYVAMDGWGTDEDAIFAVYQKIKNDLDFLKLEETFGLKDGYTLDEWLQGDLSQSELDKINSILSTNGVTYRV